MYAIINTQDILTPSFWHNLNAQWSDTRRQFLTQQYVCVCVCLYDPSGGDKEKMKKAREQRNRYGTTRTQRTRRNNVSRILRQLW